MAASPKILVVDDESSHRLMLQAVLSAEGYTIDQASSGEEALDLVTSRATEISDAKPQDGGRPFDLVLMDVKMGRLDGYQTMKAIQHITRDIPIILMTAYGTINAAVEAMKAGAVDYLTKPIDIEALKVVVKHHLENRIQRYGDIVPSSSTAATAPKPTGRSSGAPHETPCLEPAFHEIIGTSPPMQHLFDLISRAAPTDATILILGESGTGKELIARAIHRLSPRKQFPLVTVNCTSLPETLLESELFGHEQGAFTGAVRKRIGKFQAADKGTIFLDEIGEMPVPLQAKLLRVLQEKECQPIGKTTAVTVDIRVVAATNRQLNQEIQKGHFREDLFYRLNVVTIDMPPLRERSTDIPLLSKFFLDKYSRKNRRLITGFHDDVMDRFIAYHWPGNVRELENCIERAVILSRNDQIIQDDLPPSLTHPNEIHGESRTNTIPQEKSLKEMEKEMILRTLEEADGNRTRSAKILGISRRTLQLKLKEYGVNS